MAFRGAALPHLLWTGAGKRKQVHAERDPVPGLPGDHTGPGKYPIYWLGTLVLGHWIWRAAHYLWIFHVVEKRKNRRADYYARIKKPHIRPQQNFRQPDPAGRDECVAGE